MPAARRFQRQSADANVVRHHALPGEHLENLQDLFALAHAVKERAHRADIQGMRSQPHQVAVQSRQLHQHDAHPLRHRRDLNIQQPRHVFDSNSFSIPVCR